MRRASLVLAALLLLAAGAAADVVTLTNGNRISGEVVRADEREVVIKTPQGRMTFPRALVASVTTQSRGDTLLAMARERATAGAHDEAEALFTRAAADPDPELARRARAELEAYRARRERARAYRPAPTTPLPLPPAATEVEPLEGESPQEQLDRARRALETGDGARARRLLEPFVAAAPAEPRLRYLLGRACELDRDGRAAAEEYARALGPTLARGHRDVAWLGELARRHTAGDALTPDSPGVGAGWQRVETKHFAVLHPFATVEPWFAREPEDALLDVQERLRIQEHETRLSGRIQVILYPSAEAYQQATQVERAAGHAEQHAAPDGTLVLIRAYPDQAFYRATYRHEVAHALLFGLLEDLPGWAHEGAATYCEPLRERAFRRRIYVGRRAQGALPGLADLFGGRVARGASVDEVRTYYAACCVTFEALVGLRGGPREALTTCRRLEREGLERGLGQYQLTADDVLDAAARVAADQTAPADGR